MVKIYKSSQQEFQVRFHVYFNAVFSTQSVPTKEPESVVIMLARNSLRQHMSWNKPTGTTSSMNRASQECCWAPVLHDVHRQAGKWHLSWRTNGFIKTGVPELQIQMQFLARNACTMPVMMVNWLWAMARYGMLIWKKIHQSVIFSQCILWQKQVLKFKMRESYEAWPRLLNKVSN